MQNFIQDEDVEKMIHTLANTKSYGALMLDDTMFVCIHVNCPKVVEFIQFLQDIFDRHHGKIHICFGGLDEDIREVYEHPRVQAICSQIGRAIPKLIDSQKLMDETRFWMVCAEIGYLGGTIVLDGLHHVGADDIDFHLKKMQMVVYAKIPRLLKLREPLIDAIDMIELDIQPTGEVKSLQ